LRHIFIVSKILLKDELPDTGEHYKSEEIEGLSTIAGNAPGEKCERCWIYDQTVGKDTEKPTVCERCRTALVEIG